MRRLAGKAAVVRSSVTPAHHQKDNQRPSREQYFRQQSEGNSLGRAHIQLHHRLVSAAGLAAPSRAALLAGWTDSTNR